MKSFYAFIFAFFISWGAVGQTIQLLTPAADAPGIIGTNPQPGYGYFPNSTTGNVYSFTQPGFFVFVSPPVADANTNVYKFFFNVSNIYLYTYISRINNKWTLKIHQYMTSIGPNVPSQTDMNVLSYETIESFNTTDPPCSALFQLTSNNGATVGGVYQLEFSTPCVDINAPAICNTEMYPKLINLAGVSATTFNSLNAIDNGLRMGSMVYNYSQQQAKYYDGIKWNEIYSPSNSLLLAPGKTIVFTGSANSWQNVALSKNSDNQLDVFGGLVVSGILKSKGTITQKVASIAINSTAVFPFPSYASVIIVNMNAHRGITLPTATTLNEGLTYTVKNQSATFTLELYPVGPYMHGNTTHDDLLPGTSITMISDGTKWIKLD